MTLSKKIQGSWMDEEAMLVWVDRMPRPHIETSPPGVMPIVSSDTYRCHMMASVVTRIQNLGVEVQHIPGGCTSLCQPVDIGVNKPFKNRLRSEWEKWMILEGLEHGTTSPPTRADIIRSFCLMFLLVGFLSGTEAALKSRASWGFRFVDLDLLSWSRTR